MVDDGRRPTVKVDGRRATVRAGGRRGAHAWWEQARAGAATTMGAGGVWWRKRDAGVRRNERVNDQGVSNSGRWQQRGRLGG